MSSTNGGPGGAWPLQTGNDFLPNHMANGIDYASIHMWPDNWGRTDKAFGQTWLAAHIADVKYLGKPLVLEEFGKAVGAYLNLISDVYACAGLWAENWHVILHGFSCRCEPGGVRVGVERAEAN